MTAMTKSARGIAAGRIAALLVCLALPGCGESGPGVDDVKIALNDYLDRFFGHWTPLNNHIRAQEIKDVSCSPADGKPGFICSYNWTATEPGKNGLVDKGKSLSRFTKEGEKWTLMRDR